MLRRRRIVSEVGALRVTSGACERSAAQDSLQDGAELRLVGGELEDVAVAFHRVPHFAIIRPLPRYTCRAGSCDVRS